MAVAMFDTHVFVKELVQVGMPEEQAEVLARTHTTLIDEKLATKRGLKELELATKRDLKELETGLKRDMKGMETGLKRDMKEMELRLKHDLTVRLGSMMVLAIGVVAALVKLL